MGTGNSENAMLEGLVAQLLNARELAINIGSTHGVVDGMRFAVLAAQPIEVMDPITGDLLDRIDRPKVKVEAVDVRERMSICRTYRKTTTPGGAFYSAIYGSPASRLLDAPKTVYETLETDGSDYLPPLPPEDSYVKIGDRVIQIEEAN